MPHTHHTGDRPRPSTPLAVAFREPPPPRWSCPFALLSSSLLVHQPLLSLSSMHSHAPHVLITTTMPSIPCVVCALWGWTAPSTTVVVKHATHTLVDHCVDGSHHPTLHPPSTLTPFCAFATTNHHTIPLLQPPPPQGHCAHPLPTLLPHSHTWCGWHVPLWLLSRPVWCVVCVDGMHIPSHRPHTHNHNHCGFAHRHTTTLWCVCVHGNTCHMAMPNHQPLTCMVWSSRFLHKCVQSSPLPSTLCVCVVDWWLACVCVATCVSACVLVGCAAFHHTVCRVCLHALIHLCHHTLLLLCCCCCWW